MVHEEVISTKSPLRKSNIGKLNPSDDYTDAMRNFEERMSKSIVIRQSENIDKDK